MADERKPGPESLAVVGDDGPPIAAFDEALGTQPDVLENPREVRAQASRCRDEGHGG